MLIINNLSKAYGKKEVLNNISLEFQKATSTVLLGESGSGKTTLAKLILGIEKQDEGEIIFKGQQLQSLNKRTFDQCSQIQYIFQDPYSALESQDKIKTVLEEPRKIALRNRHNPMTIQQALHLVDKNLLNYLEEKVNTLSGGQRQKLCIARALITRPQLIIADECTSMLDEKTSEEINKLLLELVKKEKICLINITHKIDLKKDSWDKIIVLNNKKVIENMDFKDFPNKHQHSHTKNLIKALDYFAKNELQT